MKVHSSYVCQQCGYTSASYLGRCPNCGEWNSLVESVDSTSSSRSTVDSSQLVEKELVKLSEVKSQSFKRVPTGYGEFDRVLGGGIVPGSIVLIAGDPGIGKSTLLLQTAISVASGPVARSSHLTSSPSSISVVNQHSISGLRALDGTPSARATRSSATPRVGSKVVLYVTGEESAQQVKLRADRITKNYDNLYILAVSQAEAIVEAVSKIKPDFLIVDSIQTLTTNRLEGPAGSVGQVRECAQILQRVAKSTHTPIFLVGHVTKEGNVAGPKVLEHVVDAVLSLEGDGMHAFRLLRSQKNRFGSTFEVGVFEMTDSGMQEVTNPSKIFLEQRLTKRPGSVVCSTLAGGRPLLAEVQALTSATAFGVPTRRVTGLDFNRVQIVVASLARAASLGLSNLDIFVNVAGGLKIDEPAADLAVALSIASSVLNKPVGDKVCVFGEVGLLGELRPVGNAKTRIAEGKRLGFGDFVTPDRFKTLEEAVRYAIK